MSEIHKYPYEAQQEINDLERQLAEAREANYDLGYHEGQKDGFEESENEIVKLKILVQQERYENQENKLNSIRFSRSHERVVEEEIKLKRIAKLINRLKEQLKEKGE